MLTGYMDWLPDMEWISKISTPLILAGVIVVVIGLLFRQSSILKGSLTKGRREILRGIFIFAYTALIFGFVGFVLNLVYDNRGGKEQPKAVEYLKGTVVDEYGDFLKGVTVYFEEIPGQKEVTTSSGTFKIKNKIRAEQGSELRIHARKEGYKEYDEIIIVPLPKHIIMERLKVK